MDRWFQLVYDIHQERNVCSLIPYEKTFINWLLSNQIMSNSLSKSMTAKKKHTQFDNEIRSAFCCLAVVLIANPPTVIPQIRQGMRGVNNGPQESLPPGVFSMLWKQKCFWPAPWGRWQGQTPRWHAWLWRSRSWHSLLPKCRVCCQMMFLLYPLTSHLGRVPGSAAYGCWSATGCAAVSRSILVGRPSQLYLIPLFQLSDNNRNMNYF